MTKRSSFQRDTISRILLLIDIVKAFDPISWMLIENVFDFFNFGFSIKQRAKTCYAREVIINPPNLNNSYYFPFLSDVI
jgi:hypothetical protein